MRKNKVLCAVFSGVTAIGCLLMPTLTAAGDSSGGLLDMLAGKTGIVITTEPLRGNKVDVDINGKRVVTIGVEETYRGSFEAGKLVVTVKGDKLEIDAQPNKEYVLEVAMRPPSGASYFFLGVIGSSMTAEYAIALKATRDLPPAQ